MAVKKKAVVSQHDRSAGQPLEVSQGTIKTWRRCRKKYDYSYVQLIEPRKPRLQLIKGTMLGKCLDLLAFSRGVKKAPHWKTALDPYRKEYARMFEEEKEYFGDPIGDVEFIVARYERIYATDGFTYLSSPETGDPFELPVRVDIAPGIVFTGHLDKMPQDKQGRVWDMDHKSHKNLPGPDDRYVDLQQVFYQWAMPLSGYPKPSGVIWDYVRTKIPAVPEPLKKGGITQRQNIDTDYETYFGEIQKLNLDPKDYREILMRLKERGHMDFFQRVQLPKPAPDLIKNVVAEAQETAVEIKKLGGVSTTRTIDRTCKSCSYFSICQAEYRGLDADFIRKTEYQTQKDPRHVHLTVGDDD